MQNVSIANKQKRLSRTVALTFLKEQPDSPDLSFYGLAKTTTYEKTIYYVSRYRQQKQAQRRYVTIRLREPMRA